MFVIKKINKKAVIITLAVMILLCGFVARLAVLENSNTVAYCSSVGNYQLGINKDFSVADFLEQFELLVDNKTEECVSITIPSEFNAVYEKYNQLQKSQGLDLEKYKGEQAERYTYKIKNYPTGADVRADVIVCKGKVVGGDLCTVALDGIMTTFDDKTIGQE